jgi:hypothetical protein
MFCLGITAAAADYNDDDDGKEYFLPLRLCAFLTKVLTSQISSSLNTFFNNEKIADLERLLNTRNLQ